MDIELKSINAAYKDLVNETRKVFGMEDAKKEKVGKVEITEGDKKEEEKVTVLSLLEYLHVATNQTNHTVDEIIHLVTGQKAEKSAEKEPQGTAVFDMCVSLADKLVAIKNKVSLLKETIS